MNVIQEDERFSSFLINTTIGKVLLFGVHFQSKNSHSSDALKSIISKYFKDFLNIEKERKIDKTIIIGDFNVNPYDKVMIDALSVNSVMNRKVASRNTRKAIGIKKYYFYNPMWHLMGNYKRDVQGSYYLSSKYDTIYWHTIDQIIVRPKLMEVIDIEKILFITKTDNINLLTSNGLPDKKISDHLPLLAEIELEV